METKKPIVIGAGSIYGQVPVGSFLSSVYRVKKHVLSDDPNKLEDFNITEAVTVLNVDEIEVTSLREIPVMGKTNQIILNDDQSLIFPKDQKFAINITDKVECDKTIIGDEKTALYACQLINEENLMKLEKHIEELMGASQSLRSTVERQKGRIIEIDRMLK